MGKDLIHSAKLQRTKLELVTRRHKAIAFSTAEEQTFFQLELVKDRMVAVKSLRPLVGTKVPQRHAAEGRPDDLLNIHIFSLTNCWYSSF